MEIATAPGDVVVLKGDPEHMSEHIDGSRIVALLFYKRTDGQKEPATSIQTFPRLLQNPEAYVTAVKTNFAFGLSQEDFGGYKWNNITNYTHAPGHEKRAKRKENEHLKPPMKALQEFVEAGVSVDFGPYELVEQFVNWYDPDRTSNGKPFFPSTTSGIKNHEDGTDMSIVVQLENRGEFSAKVESVVCGHSYNVI